MPFSFRHYIKLEDQNNKNLLKDHVKEIIEKHSVKRVIITHPSEYRILQEIKQWKSIFSIPVQIREDNRFLCTPGEFSKWAGDKKQLRMEFFYREIRKKHDILMRGCPRSYYPGSNLCIIRLIIDIFTQASLLNVVRS